MSAQQQMQSQSTTSAQTQRSQSTFSAQATTTPAIVNKQPTTISTTGGSTTTTTAGGSTSSKTSEPVNYALSFGGKAATEGTYKGTFISEQTHFQGTNGTNATNFNAQAYNLNNIPRYSATMQDIQAYGGSNWFKNSSPAQLEALNDEVFRFDPNDFESAFIIQPPVQLPPVVDNSVGYYKSLQQSNPGQAPSNDPRKVTWGDRIKQAEQFAIKGQAANNALNRASNFYETISNVENVEALGESVAAAGEGLLSAVGAEGVVAGAVEAIGGAAVLGTGAATLGILALGGFAAYEGYQAAVALGAPTLGQDFDYIGKGARSIGNSIENFLGDIP